MRKEEGYILIEVLLVSILLVVLTSILATINLTALECWESNQERSNLQREALITMEMIVNMIKQGLVIEEIQDSELTLVTAAGEKKKLYYKPGQGLCWAADNNVVSNRVVSLNFTKQSESLLIIKLVIKVKNRSEKLQTGIEI